MISWRLLFVRRQRSSSGYTSCMGRRWPASWRSCGSWGWATSSRSGCTRSWWTSYPPCPAAEEENRWGCLLLFCSTVVVIFLVYCESVGMGYYPCPHSQAGPDAYLSWEAFPLSYTADYWAWLGLKPPASGRVSCQLPRCRLHPDQCCGPGREVCAD